MTSIRLTIALTVLGAFCLLPFNAAFAQSDSAFIKYRQHVMDSMGANMGAIGTILKEKLPLKANIEEHAVAVHAATTLIASAFKHKAAEGMTDAKAKIWEDSMDFAKKAKDAEKASAHLISVAKTGDMAAIAEAVKGVGKTCGGCHKEFRKPKEESYKNKM
ncbi:MAG TPA: cytochrome c [bacterium]|nr:cytochrome c [bacterium]